MGQDFLDILYVDGLTVCLRAEWTPGRVEQGYRAAAGERSVSKVPI